MKCNLRVLLIFLLGTLWVTQSTAQDRADFKGTIAYLEISGNSGPSYSITLEHSIFKMGKWHANAHAGYGYFKSGRTLVQALPIGINVFHGDRKSHFEAGLGLTFAEGVSTLQSNSDYYRSKAYYFVPSVGYRLQKPNGGFFFKSCLYTFFQNQRNF